MQALHTKWQDSGQSKKAFAISENIKPSTFCYWAKKFEQSSIPTNNFLPVPLELAAELPVTATIHYPSGIRVEWHGGSEIIDQLKTLH